VVATRFEWDEKKGRSNRAKHGVSFETAKRAFEDPNLITRQDREVEDEQRWQTIGYAEGVLTVAHTAMELGGRRDHPHHLGATRDAGGKETL
jgi:uncharacterized DUF497 family protein